MRNATKMTKHGHTVKSKKYDNQVCFHQLYIKFSLDSYKKWYLDIFKKSLNLKIEKSLYMINKRKKTIYWPSWRPISLKIVGEWTKKILVHYILEYSPVLNGETCFCLVWVFIVKLGLGVVKSVVLRRVI